MRNQASSNVCDTNILCFLPQILEKLGFNTTQFVIFVFMSLFYTMGFGATIDTIHVPDKSASIADITFQSNTRVLMKEHPSLDIILSAYKGETKLGLANGKGRLTGYYLIPSTENELYKDLKSSDEVRRTMAEVSVERTRGNAVHMSQDPDLAVKLLLGLQSLDWAYDGEFLNGRPTGAGTIHFNYLQINGQFLNWMPEGMVIFVQNEREVATLNFSKGRLVDGDIHFQEYPPFGLQPSRIFVGKMLDGKIDGEWIDLPWVSQTGDIHLAGFAGSWTQKFEDGRLVTCTGNTSDMKSFPQANSILSISPSSGGGNGDGVPQANLYLQASVSDYVYHRMPVRCVTLSLDGWKYSYTLTNSTVLPSACADPKGALGVFTFAGNNFVCTTTTVVRSNPFKRIGREIGRWAADAEKILLLPGKTMGSAAGDVCKAFGYEEGKNCGANLYAGTSFQIPEARSKSDPVRSIERLNHIKSQSEKVVGKPLRDAWGISSLLWADCLNNCPDKLLPFAQRRLDDLNAQLSVGFAEDIGKYKLASSKSDAFSFRSLLNGALSNSDTYLDLLAWEDASKQFQREMDYIAAQPSIGYEGNKIFILYLLNKSADKFVLNNLIKLMTGFVDFAIPDVSVSIIPGLSKHFQLFALAASAVDAKKFYDQYKDIKSAHEFYEKMFAENRIKYRLK
jgi:hypothetical protein